MGVDFDSVVIGAGVIGLAVARQLSMAGCSVLVLEKAHAPGTETSSRNSEVIHAGIYYPTGSLKARLCIEGRKMLYGYCASRNVAMKPLGKIIVATMPEEEKKLEAIAALAKANGVGDLKWLTAGEVAALEPEVFCTRALLSPSTGIINSGAYMLALQADVQSNSATIAFNTTFSGAVQRQDAFLVRARDASGETAELACNALINCAGHGAHTAALAIEGISAEKLPPRFLAKGSYCSVTGKSPFRHLIYPVPVPGALGIHATLDMNGSVRFGPDIQWVEDISYSLAPDLPQKFSRAVAAYWPGVRERDLAPSYCGIRPKSHGPDAAFADFCIQDVGAHGVRGLINLFGIESPGITASLAIAQHVVGLLEMA
jgi:L-2-hydroxyglutarate oxidase LhgO